MSTDEAPPEQNPHGKSPEAQGSNIPLGWKPTPAQPVPVVRCTQIKKDGERCKRWSIRGYHKCVRHAGPGAKMKDGNVAKYAEMVIESARLRLIDSSEMALDVLEGLTQPGTGEAIRLKAATEILDRAGVRGGFEVKVEGEIIQSPAEELQKRMDKLREGALAVQRMRAERDAADVEDVVDAELVEEDPEQPSLFELDEAEESTDEHES